MILIEKLKKLKMQEEPIIGTKIQINKFGGPEQLKSKQIKVLPPQKGEVKIKILAVSVGITDLMARSGKYLLQPFTPLTPGYDCIGEIIDWHPSVDSDLTEAKQGKGTRVAICLPRMGTYITHLSVKPWQIVTLPDSLDTIRAAAIPLDYLTAFSLVETHAQIKKGQNVLIHGGSGAVGSVAVRLAVNIGANVYATGSLHNKNLIEGLGAHFLNYSDTNLHETIQRLEPNGMDAVLLHFGGELLKQARRMTKKQGIVVNYAFTSNVQGWEKLNTLFGALNIKLRQSIRWFYPRSAICSVPSEIAKNHDWYRKTLKRSLESVSNEQIRIDSNHIYPLHKVSEAHRIMRNKEHNGKLILTCN